MKAIRILLADDHTLVRAGMRALLSEVAGFEVVGEARDGHQALALIRELLPDVAIVDISMPGMNGMDLTARVTREFPGVHILIVSMHSSNEYIQQTMRSGACGYLVKGADPAELERAMRTLARGEKWFTTLPGLSPHDAGRRNPAEPGVMEKLTPRQREILQLIAEGNSVKEIAFLLKISIKTVETHRADLMERLNIFEVAGLTRYAIRMGMITTDP
ncbi:MAG: response regulator [Blastocatellia bacterium]